MPACRLGLTLKVSLSTKRPPSGSSGHSSGLSNGLRRGAGDLRSDRRNFARLVLADVNGSRVVALETYGNGDTILDEDSLARRDSSVLEVHITFGHLARIELVLPVQVLLNLRSDLFGRLFLSRHALACGALVRHPTPCSSVLRQSLHCNLSLCNV